MAKVLVIEDDANNQEIVARFLRREGHAILQASNGRDGVAIAETEAPDIILMDLNLPEMDGWEATRRIKAQPHTAKIPIIALTAHSQLEDVKRAMGAGCDHFETKPVVYPRLMRKIEAILSA